MSCEMGSSIHTGKCKNGLIMRPFKNTVHHKVSFDLGVPKINHIGAISYLQLIPQMLTVSIIHNSLHQILSIKKFTV